MIIVVIYALFGEDVRYMLLPVEVDTTWWGMSSAATFFFSVEICLAFYSKKEYWCSFFFWLDTLSTLSLLFDIGWFINSLTSLAGGNGVSGAQKATKLARIVRIVWLIWLVWIVKLYK